MDVDDGQRRIGSDPFTTQLDTVRRLRGQLVAPVTVWTAYDSQALLAGVTVSSMLVVEGDSPAVFGLVGPLTDFWEAVSVTERFVVHVLAADHVRVADQFALRYPCEPFEGLATSHSPWGPILDAVPTRVSCSLSSWVEAGYQFLVQGVIHAVDLPDDPPLPLAHYRGRYVTIGPRRREID